MSSSKSRRSFVRRASAWASIGLLTSALLVLPAWAGLKGDWQTCRQPNDLEQQIAACTRVLKSESGQLTPLSRAQAFNNRGTARWMKRELGLAIADYTQAIQIEPRYQDPHSNRGSVWFEQGQFDRALADYNQALRLNPDFPEALLGRGNVLVARREYDAALADFNKAISSRRNFANAHLGRGNALLGKDDVAAAILDFETAIRINPQLAEAFNSRGEALRRKGEYDRAIANFDEAIRLAPNVGRFYAGRATAFVEKKEFGLAERDFDSAIRVGPRQAVLYNNRGLLRRDMGDYARAAADYDEAIRLEPDHPKAYANRGEIWRLKGDLERALADQSRQIRLHPNEQIGYILRADTYRYKGEFARALADYEVVLREKPQDIPALTGRGLTFEKMGDRERARADFEKAAHSRQLDRSDINGSALETARARLAAIGSGATPPVILPVPAKAVSETSLPTPSITAPILTRPVEESREYSAVPKQGRRVALVIGNSAYRRVPELVNPKRDADAIAASLRHIGFEVVITAADTSREKLIETLRAFATEADKADWAMVYYAGHGIEVNGQNYLIPVDAALKTDRDVQFETVPLDQVMSAIDGARKIKLIVLDACRDNPFTPKMEKTGISERSDAVLRTATGERSDAVLRTATGERSDAVLRTATGERSDAVLRTAMRDIVPAAPTAGGAAGTRSIGRGLGEVKVSGASLVVFAAKHGQTALDGEGGNSPFAIALVQRIATPGVEINKIFRLVRDDVMEATAGRQEPYTYGSLPGREDFFFVAAK